MSSPDFDFGPSILAELVEKRRKSVDYFDTLVAICAKLDYTAEIAAHAERAVGKKLSDGIAWWLGQKEKELRAEVARLTKCLTAANAQAEKFEREWYLRGDENEALRAENARLRAELASIREEEEQAGWDRDLQD